MVIPRDLPTEPSYARQIEQCEVEAWLDLDASVLSGSRPLDVRAIDGALLILDSSTDWPHSRIFNLGVVRPATPEVVQRILETARAAGIETLSTDVSPIARPGTLARILGQAGFHQTERNVIVARDTAGVQEPDSFFRIRLVERADTDVVIDLVQSVMPGALDWTILLAGQISRPNWRYYLAFEDGVACALSGIHIHGNMAWLSPIWVRENFRNRGTQAAIIAYAVRDAEASGVEWITTSYPAAVPGRTRNFERLGFSMVYLRNHFVWQAPAS
jgi:GNAT superfamily N-acetyltransferase